MKKMNGHCKANETDKHKGKTKKSKTGRNAQDNSNPGTARDCNNAGASFTKQQTIKSDLAMRKTKTAGHVVVSTNQDLVGGANSEEKQIKLMSMPEMGSAMKLAQKISPERRRRDTRLSISKAGSIVNDNRTTNCQGVLIELQTSDQKT